VSGVNDEALGRGTGHDGARSLGHGAGELHDLGVPHLVRDVSLSVLGDSLLSGRAPGGDGSNVSHVLVVHGSGLEVTTGLAFLVHDDLLSTGVSGSAPVLDDLSLGNESLGVGLLVGELVEEVLGSLAHLRVEHVSLHGGRESDVADESGVKSGSLLSSNDDSVSSELGELGTSVGGESVSDVEVGSERGSSTDSVVVTDNSGGNLLGVVSSGDVSSADGESLGEFNSLSLERADSVSIVDLLGVLGSSGDSDLTGDDNLGVSEVSSSELGVPGEHLLLEENLSSVFTSGRHDLERGNSGESLELDSSHLEGSSGSPELELESKLESGGDLSTDGSSGVIGSLDIESTLLSLESAVVGSDVNGGDLDLASNTHPLSGSELESSVCDFGSSADLGLVSEDDSHLEGDLSLDVGNSPVVSGDSLVLSTSGDSVRESHLEDSGHVLGLGSESPLSLLVGNSSNGSSDSDGSSAHGDLLVVDSKGHSSLSDKSEMDELSLDSSGGNSLDVEFVVDSSPVDDSSSHDDNGVLGNSVGGSKSQPDSSEVLLLDDLV